MNYSISILYPKTNTYSDNLVNNSYHDDNDNIVALNAFTLGMVGDKDSIILISTYMNGITIAVDKYIISRLQNIHNVVFKFVNTHRDAPPIYAENDLEFEVTNLISAINVYSEYLRYKLINTLPYEDFAVDRIPEVYSILINGVPSTLFEELNSHMCTILGDCKQIDMYYETRKYQMKNEYTMSKKKNGPYIRLNQYSSLFHPIHIYTYKHLINMTSFEITFSWFSKNLLNQNITLEDSSIDDYVYSYIEINDFLTLSAVFDLILSCYKADMKEYQDTHILINIFKMTFKDAKRVCEKIVPLYDGKLPYINILDHIITTFV